MTTGKAAGGGPGGLVTAAKPTTVADQWDDWRATAVRTLASLEDATASLGNVDFSTEALKSASARLSGTSLWGAERDDLVNGVTSFAPPTEKTGLKVL